VLLYNELVGTLTKLPDDQIIFAFDQSYIKNPNRPTLSLSFKDQLGELITEIPPARSKLPAFFSNLLPEGYLREYLTTSMQVDQNNEFALLSLLGQDLPGAITVTPAGHLNLSSPAPKEEHRKVYEDNILKFSLAGVQLKFPAVEISKRLTIPAHGIGGSWIVKLPSIRFPNIAENEFSIMRLASLIGINVPDIKIIPIGDVGGLPKNIGALKGNAFAIERFDRPGHELMHIEDFAQVFGVYPENKYEKASYKDLAEVIYIEGGVSSLEEFITRLVFNSLIGNADMHLKNWSLIYPDKTTAAIAPAYDFVSTIAYIADKTMALKYVKRKFTAELSVDLLSYLSAKAKLPERLVINTARQTVQKFLEVWEKEKTHLLLRNDNIQIIERHFNGILLVKEVR